MSTTKLHRQHESEFEVERWRVRLRVIGPHGSIEIGDADFPTARGALSFGALLAESVAEGVRGEYRTQLIRLGICLPHRDALSQIILERGHWGEVIEGPRRDARWVVDETYVGRPRERVGN